MKKPSLGEQELDLLTFVTTHAPIALSDVVEQYGPERGLARTTIHTVLERLRKKGYLVREQHEGIYRYQPKMAQSEVLTGVVGDFVQGMLNGSLKPFVAYLSSKELTEEEMQELKALLKRQEAQREGGRDAE